MSSRTCSLRALGPADAERFQALRLEALQTVPEAFGSSYEEEAPRLLAEVAARLEPADGRVVLGAFDQHGSLIGVVGFLRETKRKSAHKGQIWGMYVKAEARGLGLGRRLLEAALEQAARLPGLEQVQLSVAAGNTAAERLYAAAGFETWGLEREALKLGTRTLDERHMVLFLERRAQQPTRSVANRRGHEGDL